MTHTRNVLSLAVEIGNEMLSNGAEIYRVEESMARIIESFHIHRYHIYTISNAIFVNIREGEPDAVSTVRQVPLGAINLYRLTQLNQLTRDLTEHKCTMEEAFLRIEIYKKAIIYRPFTLILFGGLAGFAFCYLLGGTWLDSIFAFFISMLEEHLLLTLDVKKISGILKNIAASFLVTVVSCLLTLTPLPLSSDNMIIGAIMLLVPGVGITTAIRDYLNAEYLSGTIRLVSAFLVGFCIVVGVLSGTWICQFFL